MAGRQTHVDVYRPVVWVVGASRGIGREIARQFAIIGCRVCLSGRNAGELAAAVQQIETLGGRGYAFPCDVSDERIATATVKKIVKRIGRVDVLVNSAGVTVFKSFLHTSSQEFHDVVATNLQGYIHCMKAVLPTMARRKRGWVINILSTAAVKTFKGSAAYTASKAGMHGLSKVVREEMRPFNVRIVDVFPGPTDTPMWSPATRRTHSRRMMKAKSVAEAVVALYQFPPDVVPEEIVLRPVGGDLE